MFKTRIGTKLFLEKIDPQLTPPRTKTNNSL